MQVWDAATGQEALALKGHTGMVIGVAFSPDGRRLASGQSGQDGEGLGRGHRPGGRSPSRGTPDAVTWRGVQPGRHGGSPPAGVGRDGEGVGRGDRPGGRSPSRGTRGGVYGVAFSPDGTAPRLRQSRTGR